VAESPELSRLNNNPYAESASITVEMLALNQLVELPLYFVADHGELQYLFVFSSHLRSYSSSEMFISIETQMLRCQFSQWKFVQTTEFHIPRNHTMRWAFDNNDLALITYITL
jgi:hypothetical protein